MYLRTLFIVIAAVGGIAVGSLVPEVAQTVRTLAAGIPLPGFAQLMAQDTGDATAGQSESKHAHGKAGGHGHGEAEKEGPEGVIKITADRVAVAKIEVASIGGGVLARRLTVPGTITPDSNRIARVAAKVVGTVAELNKQLGDAVAKGDLVAVLESREVAEAKSEYLAAQVNFDLQKTLFEREQSLFQKNITAEQQFLRARTTFSEAQLRASTLR